MPNPSGRNRHGSSAPTLAQSMRSKISQVLTPEEQAQGFMEASPKIRAKIFQALTLEEQELLIERYFQGQPCSDVKKMNLRYQLIEEQFHAAEYSKLYFQAHEISAEEDGDVRLAANMLWAAFQQASALGRWAPGRFQILYGFQILYDFDWVYPNQNDIRAKDVKKLNAVFNDENELTTIRMIAAFGIGCALPCDTDMSPEEKWEIVRTAAKLVPPSEELKHRVVFDNHPHNNQKSNLLVSSVKDIFRQYQKYIEELLKIGPEQDNDMIECIPSEVDPELHRRTSEIGGCKCDYCHKTVEELGVAKLKICGKCQNAYYCGAECQLKAWKEGHKKVCRPMGDVHDGDIMRLRGLKNAQHLNGRLVEVLGQDVDSGQWWVCLFAELKQLKQDDDTSTIFQVKTKNMQHIRPAA